MNRVFVVDKQRGLTSHDVVARVRRATRIKKVGHSGTLDPDATGVLIVLVGKATRLAQFFVDLEKRYRGRVVLGATTDTQDAAGQVLTTADTSGVSAERIERVFEGFLGDSEQVPPMVSALKKDGIPLYVLARRGESVERESRPITISELRVLSIEMPEVEFELTCSRGTYVRTLAADIGDQLGCGGHLGQLARTAIGPFTLDSATSLDEIERAGKSSEGLGLSMFDSLSFMPELIVTEREADVLSTGGAIEVKAGRLPEAGAFVRLSMDGVELIAVGKRTGAAGRGAAAEGKQEEADEAAREEKGHVLTVRPVRVFVEPF